MEFKISGRLRLMGKSVMLLLVFLLISIAGFYGLLIMISMMHTGSMVPNGTGAAVISAMGFLVNFID